MKVLCVGDLHITDKKPARRVDENYLQTVINKFQFILKAESKDSCVCVLQPGDFFDSASVSEKTKVNVISETKGSCIFTVFGQHDQRYHSSKSTDNTSMAVLLTANSKYVTLLTKKPLQMGIDLNLYGCSWGEDVPEIKNKEHFNILVIHKTFLEAPGSDNFAGTPTKTFLKEYPFDLVVAGDNHKTFVVKYKDRILINAGSMMRTSRNQIDHKPCVFVFDTDTRTFEKIYIPIEKEVFTEEPVTTLDNEDLILFAEELVGLIDSSKFDFKKVIVAMVNKKIELKQMAEEIIGRKLS